MINQNSVLRLPNGEHMDGGTAPFQIHPGSERHGIGAEITAQGAAIVNALVIDTQFTIIYTPVRIQTPVILTEFFFLGNNTTGNFFVSLYDMTSPYDRLVTMGGATANQANTVDGSVANTLVLPGYYWIAVSTSDIAGQFFGWQPGTFRLRTFGCAQEASASHVHPAQATPVTITKNVVPMAGFNCFPVTDYR